MAEKRYQVVGHAALITQEGPLGTAKLLLLRGAIIGPGMTELERTHNEAGGLIAEVPGSGPVGVDAAGVPVVGTERVVGDGEPGSPEVPTPTATPTGADTTAKPDGGKKPARDDPKADWVEYAVSRGLSREESERSSKQDLIDALK